MSNTTTRLAGSYYPGIVPPIPTRIEQGIVVRSERRVGEVDQIEPDPDRQPIHKLHGSTDWGDGSGSLFVMGGGKGEYIASKPLLTHYFEIFGKYLRKSD